MAPDEKSAADQWVGRTIAGKYRVESLLGKGGMGLVVRARHIRLDEDVAIKLLLPAMLEVPGMVTRFLREARAASKIKSPHVVRVTDVDVLDDGVPYMVMELLEGVSIAALRRREGTFSIEDSCRFLLQACDAIAEAHSLGIVHRDLKPANLFLARARDGSTVVKVLDFGISKVDAPGEHDTTKTGQMMGSPKYMAPEQMLSMHDVDARADVWSLGAILYDMVTGRTPFVADTVAQLCSAVLHDKPPPPRQFREDLPEALEAAILRCLQRDRVDRFRDVASLAAAIAPFTPATAQPDFLRGPLRSSLTSAKHTDEVPTVSVPASYRGAPLPATNAKSDSPSGSAAAPPSAHGATESVWNKTPHGAAPMRRFRVVVGALSIVAASVGWLIARGARDQGQSIVKPVEAATARDEAPALGATIAPVEPPEPKAIATVAVAEAPAATNTAQPNAASTTDGPKTTGASPVRTPTKRVSKEAPSAADGDPFGGRRK